MSRYYINITALSKTQLAEEGSTTESDRGYTFYWKGKADNEDRIYGVGFAIKSGLLKHTPVLPTGINERLLKFHLSISDKHSAIISAYPPPTHLVKHRRFVIISPQWTTKRCVCGGGSKFGLMWR